MKILQVGSSLFDWGGIERYVSYLTTGLRARGHQVEVLCPPGSHLDQRVPSPKQYLAMRRQFDLTKLPSLLRLFRSRPYDVVHIHFAPDFVLPAWAARMTRHPRVIMTRHLVLPWSSAKVRRYARLFDHFIAVSEATKRKLVESGIRGESVSVAKAGCPPLESSCRPVEPFTVGFFGRLVEEKGIGTMLQAAEKTDARIAIFGDGPLRSDVEQHSGVDYGGSLTDVTDAMASVHAIVVPSIWQEAFPFAVLEAMSLGKPVIASAVGGLPEMVEHEVTGLLVNPRDAEALAAAIERLRVTPQLVEAMGRAARETHNAHYTVSCMAARIEEVYEKVEPHHGSRASL
jgi:glycosyltransferase involved in cell wall biosynthesis